jgi:hypothetical protein
LDFNGDGYADISTADQTAVREIVFGNSAGNTTTHDVGASWSGNASATFHVAKGAGDYNGDGYQDLLTATDSTGYAGLVYGNAAGSFTFNSNTASIGVTFGAGTTGFATAGSNVTYSTVTGAAYLGDSNRDGLADVAFSNYATGTVYVKFGTATQVATQAIDATTVAASTGRGFVVSGLSTALVTATFWQSETVGANVASAGDMNGDGYADLLVMSPGNSAAYVVYGKPTGSVVDVNVASMSSAQGFKVSVSNSAWHFGMNGASIGDVNADGYGDVVIGEPDRIAEGGAVIVFGGATAAHGDINADSIVTSSGWAAQLNFAGMTYNGSTLLDGMGSSIGSSAGDVNGDGLSDFSIAGSVLSSRPFIVYGDTAMTSLALNPLSQGSSVSGTAAAERLLGTSGNDTLSGGGGADALSAGAGNDTVLVHDASFLRVDGGLGIDSFKLDATASSVNLDFTASGLGGKVYGFESIDITGGGSNSLKLTLQDVLAQPNAVDTAATTFNEAHLMVISGNGTSTLTVASSASLNPGSWSAGTALSAGDKSALAALGYQFVSGDSYTVHTNGLATLIVDNAMTYQVL